MARSRFAILMMIQFIAIAGCGGQTPALGVQDTAVVDELAAAGGEPDSPVPAAKQKDAPQKGQDSSRRMLEELLRPGDKLPPLALDGQTGAHRFPAGAALEPPELPLSRPEPMQQRTASPFRSPSPPLRNLPEAAAAFVTFEEPLIPQRIELPTTPRVRLASVDVNLPVPLPYLGHYRTDGVTLEDPTAEASLAAALARPAPARSGPAPFVPLNLPEPYEHRRLRPAADEIWDVPPIIPLPP
jgi:hypothetical protein